MLEEPPAQLIRQAIESFEIDPDIQILRRIEAATSKTEAQRNSRIDQYKTNIAQLEKQKQILEEEIRAITTPSATSLEILNKIGDTEVQLSTENTSESNIFDLFQKKSEEIDKLKVHYAKEMNSLESQINSMNIVIVKLNEKLDALLRESESIVSDNILNNPDSKIMKINLYKSLGVIIEEDINEASNSVHDKILIYNQQNRATNILDVTDKYSEYFVTNHIWDNL